MRWGRIFLAAVAVTVFDALYGMLTCGWLFKWVYAIPPTDFWKPVANYTSMFWVALTIGNFILLFLLAAVFGWICKCLPGKCCCCRGSAFGLIVWLVGVLPGMFALYMFTVIAPAVLYYWGISGLVELQIVGLIISCIYGKGEGETCCVG